mgnify:CR=1 FL=1
MDTFYIVVWPLLQMYRISFLHLFLKFLYPLHLLIEIQYVIVLVELFPSFFSSLHLCFAVMALAYLIDFFVDDLSLDL